MINDVTSIQRVYYISCMLLLKYVTSTVYNVRRYEENSAFNTSFNKNN